MLAVFSRHNPCLGCPGYCCSGNLVNVCGYDVWAIATNLQSNPTDFVAFAELSEESPYNFRLDNSERSYCLALYMRELANGSHRCLFALDLPHGQVRCGMYSVRPIGCRAYPLALVGEEVVVKPWALCPAQAWDTRQLDLEYWRGELGRHDMEFSIYAFAVASWNKVVAMQPGPATLDFRPFLNFLMAVYRQLEAARGLVCKRDWPEIWRQWRRYTAKGLNPLLLKGKRITGIASWNQWLGSIEKAVAEATEQSGLQFMNSTEPEEILR